jgi:hypothetical protein
VRDGDPTALEGLCERRGPAVLAYCRIVAGDATAAAAAAEAFARFRAAVVAADDPASLNPEALLVSATRHAAAHHASVVASGLCAEVPALLAGRADRSISPANVEFLEGHLDVCWTCRAPVARFAAAERAYRDPPDDAVPPDAAKTIVAALVAAAPVRTDAGDAAPTDVSPATPAATNGTAHHDAAPVAPVADDLDAPTTDHRKLEDDRAPRRASENGNHGRDYDDASRRRSSNGGRELDEDDAPRPRSTSGDPSRRRRRRESAGALVAMRGALAAGAARAQGARRAPPEPRLGSGIYLPRPDRPGSPARGGRRERGTMRPSVVMPVVLVVVAVLVALLVAGVFGSDNPASGPRGVAPSPVAPRADTKKPKLVAVPGASDASAQAVERAKARARRRQAAPYSTASPPAKTPKSSPAPAPAPAASAPPTATPAPTPAPPAGTGGTTAPPKAQPKSRPTAKAPSRSKGPRVDAGGGATGVEPQLPKQKSKKVPELTPPAEPTTPPTPQPPG